MAFKLKKSKHPLEKRASKSFLGYPLGSVVWLGPNIVKATTAVAYIENHNGTEAVPVAFKEWSSSPGKDVRRDVAVLDAIKEYFSTIGVRSVEIVSRIMGCPHSLNYSDGEFCPEPECSYWWNRDRISRKIIA